MLVKIVRIGRLFDLYSALPRKTAALRGITLFAGLFLSEIAEELCVSRQAVHDGLLRRAEHILEEYEGKLRLLERQEQDREILRYK